ncbi:hypothetical protein F4808DRAFT_469430 [Astrocystis sublimbata]|nr:hypothetical protein F4808DRAFT_469430 [Astrocystis sublimbata]
MTTHVEEYDQSKYWVGPSMNFKSSARLHLQHLLIQNTHGYLLEPTIEKAIANTQPRVADLASKDNITTQLDGLDINPIYFPRAAYLPPGVTLKQLDILAKPLPVELVGTYDVVHIRAFGSLIQTDPSSVLSIAIELLKPSGYLQWGECRGDKFFIEAPSPEISTASLSTMSQVLKGGLQAKGIVSDWIDVLDTHLAKSGFQNVQQHVQQKRKQDYQGWTEDSLMVWEEISGLFPPKSQSPDAPMSREQWIGLFAKAVEETEQGAMVHQGHVVTTIGQKPI